MNARGKNHTTNSVAALVKWWQTRRVRHVAADVRPLHLNTVEIRADSCRLPRFGIVAHDVLNRGGLIHTPSQHHGTIGSAKGETVLQGDTRRGLQ